MKQFLMCVGVCLWLTSNSANAVDITVNGLFKGGAIITIDGRARTLKAGQRSPEGVLLVSSDGKQAVLEMDGKRQTLGISTAINSAFTEAETVDVRIAQGVGGHYFTPGRINGLAVEFMVDTGATSVALNINEAQRLGINYRAGDRITVSTANGIVTAYRVMLDSVRIGAVQVNNVEATITMGDFPEDILLGNSFLNRVEMRRDSGVLVLESRL